jgi:hypothetical protein
MRLIIQSVLSIFYFILFYAYSNFNILSIATYNLLTKFDLEDQGVDGRMGSEWILGRLAEGV